MLRNNDSKIDVLQRHGLYRVKSDGKKITFYWRELKNKINTTEMPIITGKAVTKYSAP